MIIAGIGLLALAVTLQADTTVAVTHDDRLVLNQQRGSIEIDVWDRAEILVRDDRGDGTVFRVERRGSEIRVGRRGRHVARSADYHITVPTWLPVSFWGVNADVTIRGVVASVRGNTVNGDIVVAGGRGLIDIQSVEGDVSLEGASGRIHVESVDGDVSVVDVSGPLEAASVDGAITLRGISSKSVAASTVDGDVYYQGTVEADGRYRLATHDGDVTFLTPQSFDANVSVATFSGEFESDFPFTITEIGGGKRRFSFAIGSGAAEVLLESFDGSIRLRRADGR